MTYNWFKIFNKTEFLATGLVSKAYSLNLENIGLKEILVTIGNYLGMTYEGVFLTLKDDENPFMFDGHAIYIDSNNDVFLGILVNEN